MDNKEVLKRLELMIEVFREYNSFTKENIIMSLELFLNDLKRGVDQ